MYEDEPIEPDDNRCEHLTFVTCPTCGRTYEQRLAGDWNEQG